jgi:dTDP-3-amino-2,3,6-trideoxy-4-keto-D-glucose/dTDP-3-amino-3,4,6-trideoxy-alpha-D-glucose/dTDP-2,6-dideoxy-D-kanosamine transaminase
MTERPAVKQATAPAPVRYWDYRDDYRRQREQFLAIVDRVFSSGRLILGSEVARFEKDFASYCGVGHGVGVNSATDALFLALKALGIGTGDEVVTVANTAVPTVAAIRATGATPVFVDVEEETYLMDVSRLSAVINSRTRAILPVHIFGQVVEMEPLLQIARSAGLAVVEDCAQATGARYRGRRAGSLGDAAAFSFYPTKVLGAFGDGGMVVTDREDLQRRLKRLRFYGMEEGYYAEEEGYNSRLDELQAALLSHQLLFLDAQVERRREIAAAYDAGLADCPEIGRPRVAPDRQHQYYLYTIRTPRRDQLQQHLAAQGIESRINYPTPIHLMRGYSFLGYGPGALPVTERLAGEILSLPMYPALTDGEVERVIAAIRAFVAA